MANEPTDEFLSEKVNSDPIKEGSDDQQTESHALEEDEGDLGAEGTKSDGAGSSALDETSEELTKVKDQLIRTVAEMENVRRRAQRDVENAHKFAVEKLLSDLLPVIDSLEKAVEAAKTTENPDSMAEGIRLSLKLFVSTLEKAGIAIVDPLGEPFDPQLHEAMAMVPNPDAEPNSVMDVMQARLYLKWPTSARCEGCRSKG